MEIRLFVNGRTDWEQSFLQALKLQCDALDLVPTVNASPASDDAMAVYFVTSSSPSPGDAADLAARASRDPLPIPVLATVGDAKHLPTCLAQVNAFILDRHGPAPWDALVDEVLAATWLKRRARRVFISYRRADSEAIARQLYAHLQALKYDTFLDDCSIPIGHDFQRELRWWLNDADLVILLVSPRLDTSEWVKEEVAFANNASIGILGITWPDEAYGALSVADRPHIEHALMGDQVHPLAAADFLAGATFAEPAKQTLRDDAVAAISSAASVSRARAIRNRLTNLLPFAIDQLGADFDVTTLAALGDLELRGRTTSRTVRTRVLPFRPTIDTFFAFYQELISAPSPPGEIGCFYEENDPMHDRVKALSWLVEGTRPETEPLRRLNLWPYDGRLRTP